MHMKSLLSCIQQKGTNGVHQAISGDPIRPTGPLPRPLGVVTTARRHGRRAHSAGYRRGGHGTPQCLAANLRTFARGVNRTAVLIGVSAGLWPAAWAAWLSSAQARWSE